MPQSPRCSFKVSGRRCTRPDGHTGACRHIAARAAVAAMPAPRPLPVVIGPQLALAGTGVKPARRRVEHTSKARHQRKVLAATLVEGGTYRQQFTNCRKCRACRTGGALHRPHGPYWYLEINVKRGSTVRKVTRYVGKSLPAGILAHVATHGHPDAMAAAAEQLAELAAEAE